MAVEIVFNRSGQSVSLPDDVRAWARTFGTGMMDAGELTYLAATLAACPWDETGIVVEIGAYHGSTSVFMAKVVQHLGHTAPILSIDPFERVGSVEPSEGVPSRDDSPGGLRRLGQWLSALVREPPPPPPPPPPVPVDPINPRGAYAAYLETVRHHGVADVCLPLVAFSKDAARVVPATVGVLVVDGGHDYPVVSRDLALYAPKVRPGGFILVDDYIDAYPGVQQAVQEYFVAPRPFTIVHQGYFVIAQRLP